MLSQGSGCRTKGGFAALPVLRRLRCYHRGMTQLDVLYRYGVPPSEAVALAVARVREVYGVRAIAFDEDEKTVRVEYDATRLNEATIHQLLRRAGLDLIERVILAAPPEPAPVEAATAATK